MIASRSGPAGRGRAQTGFTLLELALTLAILGIIAAGVLVPFVTQVAQRNVSSTERILEQAKEALLGFAVANGRLPCPATAASNGIEQPVGGGACASFFGFLPAATLGFTPVDANGYSRDAWALEQNRIRYTVSDDGGLNTFTTAGAMRAAGPAALVDSNLILVCPSGAGVTALPPSCGAGTDPLATQAVVVIWSRGANAASGGFSVHEQQNEFPTAGTIDRLYVSRPIGNDFDDVVTWISTSALISRMVIGGQLP